MTTIVVALKDILTDVDHPIALTALPEDEAIQHIKDIYGFLALEYKHSAKGPETRRSCMRRLALSRNAD